MPAAAPITGQVEDGAFYFGGGMDSCTNPLQLTQDKYVFGENVSCRGGLLQNRPGYASIFGLPCGNLQGFFFFQPFNGHPQFLAAVDGLIYVSPAPFTSYYQIPGIKFYAKAKYIAWAQCVQTATYDADGKKTILNPPVPMVVMQDGFSRAAYWDGGQGRHLNPTPSGVTDPTSGDVIVAPGTYETVMGLWMAWAGNRLWVSRGNQVFASDIGDPLHFSEQVYLSNLNSFSFPDTVTGLVQPYADASLIIFTNRTFSFLQAGIQDRTQWATTNDFQVDYYWTGCVSHRSIARQGGLTWWYSPGGWINLNQAQSQTINSIVQYADQPMAYSKYYLSPDLTGVASCAFEQYIVLSVPSGDVKNSHTWALDFSQPNNQYTPPRWEGIWTGTRPVEWGAGVVNGKQRCFYASCDYDGVNRIWEAFLPDRTDNGQPITCAVQHRYFNFALANPDNLKDFLFYRLEIAEMLGTVDILGMFAGTKGAYQKNLTKRMNATTGIFGAVSPLNAKQTLLGYKPQTRLISSTNTDNNDTECNQCGVESPIYSWYRDRAFSPLIIWSGRMGLQGIRLFANAISYDKQQGICEEDENQPHTLNTFGCEALQLDVTTANFTTYTSTATVTQGCPTGAYGTAPMPGTATASSIISQENAALLAVLQASQDAADRLQCY